jgi:hypothetical protein
MSAFFGVVLLVMAGSALLGARREYAKVRQLKAGRALSCGALDSATGQVCEVTGAAQAGIAGMVTGPVSGQSGVWFLYRITRHWWQNTTSGSGSSTRKHRKEVVHETRAEEPILVDDGSGRVVLDLAGLDLGTPAELRTFAQRGGPPEGFQGGTMGALQQFDLERQWWEYEEWVLPAGTPLFVSGEVGRHAHLPSIGKPAGRGELVVSTKGEAGVLGPARRNAIFLAIFGVAAAAGGAAILVTSL